MTKLFVSNTKQGILATLNALCRHFDERIKEDGEFATVYAETIKEYILDIHLSIENSLIDKEK